jgi:fumarylacetoacetate (FAA) hydrolase
MKLASLKAGRDGHLLVVSRDLKRAVSAAHIASTLQAALDNWSQVESKLRDLYDRLNGSEKFQGVLAFDPAACAAPLPRAYQWADGSAYVNHVELVRKARGVAMPESFWHDPLIYQGGSDDFMGPCDPVALADTAWGCDLEAEIAVITDDVKQGVTPDAALGHIKLLMLVNDVSLRELIPNELAKGFGFFQSKPASAFSPVAVTPDELGAAWQGGRVHLPLYSYVNDAQLGAPDAGSDMTFHFGQLIAHVGKTRNLAAGSIIGSGTVSNVDRSKGCGCLAEKRMLEVLADGKAKTPWLQYGDRVRITMHNQTGENIFGTIDQLVKKL